MPMDQPELKPDWQNNRCGAKRAKSRRAPQVKELIIAPRTSVTRMRHGSAEPNVAGHEDWRNASAP
jgi:hypothetical protein